MAGERGAEESVCYVNILACWDSIALSNALEIEVALTEIIEDDNKSGNT